MNLTNYKAILWDFDGVLMNSMEVRDLGFVRVLADYPQEQVDALMDYHRKNGGLSRYVKFRYFFEQIRNEQITEDQVNAFAAKFSEIMLSLLLDEKLLIQDSLSFVKANHAQIPMHIVSGSDQTELRKICQHLEIDQYFRSIHGSPTPKKQLVKEVLEANKYSNSETVLIGDASNDYDAAVVNEIDFAGYNNPNLKSLGNYIDQFS